MTKPGIPGINQQDAERSLGRVGFWIVRQGKHIVMTDGTRQVTIPRHKPIKSYTMGGVIRDAGLTIEEFRKLL